MIDNSEIVTYFNKLADVSFTKATNEGTHYHLIIVANVFLNKTKMQRQQWVYNHLKEYIINGEIHALTMQTWTEAEWEHKQYG